ncbi:MAG: universal stress protein [Anaerolineae bacterium]|nr:universal stress protein [Anaerolineae bacterium]
MYHRILLPLDGSLLAEQALPHAVALAEYFQAELILLKVLTPLSINLNLSPDFVKNAEAATQKLAGEYLDQVAARIQGKEIAKNIVTVTGRPHEEIVRFAETEQVDVVVMSTRGHSGISRWLMGSVADRVARSVNTPVFLIRTQKDVNGNE